jgi:phosphoglycolate phosphatase-like HAD superfamily hydrolase
MAVLVLDFDGTMTDAEQEGVAFVRGYLDDLCTLVGRPLADPEVHRIADATAQSIAARPAEFPFLWMGRAVAPATVDPYLRMVPIAHAIFDRFKVFTNADDRGRLLGAVLYKYNYAKTTPHFRAGAGQLFTALAAEGHTVWIVTNSDTDAVAHKIHLLANEFPAAASFAGNVYGFARKFDVDDGWTDMAEHLTLPGLQRPVLLRRRTYHSILSKLLASKGVEFRDLVVVGDIFELDLAMPLSAGARVGLVSSSHTPQYERDYVLSHPRATLLASLDDVIGLLGS